MQTIFDQVLAISRQAASDKQEAYERRRSRVQLERETETLTILWRERQRAERQEKRRLAREAG
jgi:hypothetical protein